MRSRSTTRGPQSDIAERLISQLIYDEVDFGPWGFHSFQQLALGAVDCALYDLVGNHYGVPAHQLLGGEYRRVPISWVAFTRADGALDSLQEDIQEKVEAGFESFKIKVGDTDADVDEEPIQLIREVADADATILLDAQGLWDLDEALERIERYEPLGIDGVETPVGHPGAADAPGSYYDIPLFPEEMRTIREETETPVLEHVLDPGFGLTLIEADAVDVFTVEVCSEGITRARRILDIAHAAGIDARLGSTVELGPGTAAATALATSAPAVTYPCDLVVPDLYREDVTENSLTYENGTLRPRNRPGFGVSLADGVL
jgi:muconate cycloisomerase